MGASWRHLLKCWIILRALPKYTLSIRTSFELFSTPRIHQCIPNQAMILYNSSLDLQRLRVLRTMWYQVQLIVQQIPSTTCSFFTMYLRPRMDISATKKLPSSPNAVPHPFNFHHPHDFNIYNIANPANNPPAITPTAPGPFTTAAPEL